MRLLIRTLQRIAIFAIGAISIWLIVFVVFDFADAELPIYFALLATYAIGAYVILPYAVRMGLKVLQRRRVPLYARRRRAAGRSGEPSVGWDAG